MGNKEKEDSAVEVYSYAGKDIPEHYRGLVRTRWVRSYKKDNLYMRLVYTPAYYFAYNNYVSLVLNRLHTTVQLAVLQEDDDVVLGFSVIENTCLHYVHVPKAYRRQGVGTMLVPQGIQWTTHLTKIGYEIWSTKGPNVRFNPFY